MRIFVVGSEGQIARSLKEAVSGVDGIVARFSTRPEVDLTRPETVLPAVRAFEPDLVVNPAAYTAVDRAESEPELALSINRDGAAAVAEAADALGAPVIHFSTDYVFDGKKSEAYVERDPPSPQCVYGRSKLEGERLVAAAAPRNVILRTAWVYAPFGRNFVRTMLRLAVDRDLRVVNDQVGCPTYAPDIAATCLAIGRRLAETGWRENYAGVTHLAGPNAMSWCGFAEAIMAGAAARGARSAAVEAITTADYPTPARRPANSRLATERLASVFGMSLPPFGESLNRCLDRLIGPEASRLERSH
jgi:dTDP-4-dehydrorhamnose reductase